jgi:fermentation-respiration switch protein FrsA (DUF1100 family)
VVAVVLAGAFFDLDRLLVSRGVPPEALSAADRATFDPAPKLAAGSLPLLVLHGARDTLVAPDEGLRAHRTAGGGTKTLVLVPGRGHNDVGLAEAYWQALRDFVAAVA